MVLKVRKEKGGKFSAQSFDAQGELEWESTSPMTVDELFDHLMEVLGYPQVDIYEQLFIEDPDRFGSFSSKHIEIAEDVLERNEKERFEINPLLKKQLESFVLNRKSKEKK